MWQPPCARGRRGGRRAGPLGRRRRLVPPLPHEARRAQATGMEAGQRARDTPPGKWPFLGSAPPGRARAGTWETLGRGGSVSGQSLLLSGPPSSVCKCVWVGAVRPTGSCCGTGGGWAGVSPGAADAAQLEPRPGLGRRRGRGRRELDGRDSTQGGTAGAPPAARGYLVRSCPWGTWALSQASGNCTSGAGGLGPPEGGPAAVGGCSLSPPSITTGKSRVGDAAWGSVTLGSGHSSGSPRLHPQPPRCFCQGRGLRGVLRPMGWPWSWKELGPLFKEQ